MMKICDMRVNHLAAPLALPEGTASFSFRTEGCAGPLPSFRITLYGKDALLWDSGLLENANSAFVRYAGPGLAPLSDYIWKVEAAGATGEARFSTGPARPSDWRGGFIGLSPEFTPASPEAEGKAGAPSPYLRKTFRVEKKLARAVAYATAFGIYRLYVNGKALPSLFAPLWTDYNERLHYQSYDLTDLLCEGDNAVGAVLGDGWFAGNIATAGRKRYGDLPLGFLSLLVLDYADGTRGFVATDSSWKADTGSIVYSDNQNGQFTDARLEPKGWALPGFDDGAWKSIVHAAPFGGFRLIPDPSPAVRVTETLSPVKLWEKDGRFLFDLGQNMVGSISFKVKARRGARLTFRYGEMTNADGSLYTANLRSALQTDTFIAAGEEGEVFEPDFTFHGFRYVEIAGLENAPEQSDLTGRVFHSDVPFTGSIETSSPMVNRLFQNQFWGMRGNFVGTPTDCPQRDERLGWTGDAEIFVKSACYNADCASFYTKYAYDLLDAQRPNGAVTDVVPYVKHQINRDYVGMGAAAWGDAIFVVPWTVYEMYGDDAVLEASYDGMRRYMDYLSKTAPAFLRPNEGYGDWLSIDDDTPRDLLATAFFAYDALLMEKTARVLGRGADAARFAALYQSIRAAFIAAYDEEGARLKGDTQCCYLLALKFGLAPDGAEKAYAARLRHTVERKNNHLSTGFVGVSYLLPILCDHGMSDLAYTLLLNETYPSWGYSVKNGATTIWERWNSYTIEHGFGDVSMNSFNHYSLGSVAEWMYAYMAGVKPVEPGFRVFSVRPFFSDRLDFVRARFESRHGLIAVEWKREGETLRLAVDVPAGTTCLLSADGLEERALGEGHYEVTV